VARGQTGDPLQELKKKDPILYQLEIQRRFALPLAPLLFAIAAVPLALMGQRSSRAWGPMACVVLAFSFYALLTLMQYLAKEGWLPPLVAFWAPNLLLLAVSLELLRRTELGVSR
jgi:lipopolysaccharide export LptBFGC system permease protein LptF